MSVHWTVFGGIPNVRKGAGLGSRDDVDWDIETRWMDCLVRKGGPDWRALWARICVQQVRHSRHPYTWTDKAIQEVHAGVKHQIQVELFKLNSELKIFAIVAQEYQPTPMQIVKGWRCSGWTMSFFITSTHLILRDQYIFVNQHFVSMILSKTPPSLPAPHRTKLALPQDPKLNI